MPIRPENRDRYPADWPEISRAIRTRARGQCECRGECATRGAKKRACTPPEWSRYVNEDPDPQRCQATNGAPTLSWLRKHPMADKRGTADAPHVVLTVAHLDDTPENCDPENLRAFCQACHLAYDTRLHRANREASKRGDVLPMFEVNHA